MKPIVEYQDYHLLIKDYYEERKRTSYFSGREFAKVAGFTSPTYLRLVSEGESNLSRAKIDRMVNAMGLTGYEVDYFKAMVNYGNAKDGESKAAYLKEMQKIALEYRVRVVDKEAVEYFDGWKNPVIRELAPMMPGATPRDIADECKEHVSAEEVRDVLNFLVKAGFLKKDGEKVYSQTEQTVIGSPEALPIAIRAMHKEMASMASRAVDRYSTKERFFTGVTLGVTEDAYCRIIEELSTCCKKIVSIASEYKNLEQVYRVNFQLFPCTDKIKDKKHA